MMRVFTAAIAALVLLCGSAQAADFDPAAAHKTFMDAFNGRDWDGVKAQMTDDAVFHRANAEEVYVGSDAILGHFMETIGGAWNVKFAVLDTVGEPVVGLDGRVVERGDFAVTAGGDDSACYQGSYLMTWMPSGESWMLQQLAWQDVEVDIENC